MSDVGGSSGLSGLSGGMPTDDRGRMMAAFAAAVVISIVIGLVPYARTIIYPFALFATWAHEMGHGIGGLITGNEFVDLEVYRNLGGQAQLLAIQLALSAWSTRDYLFIKGFERNGFQNSDTQNIAEELFLPYWFWGGLLGGLSIVILCWAFWVAWIRPLRETS